MKKIIITTFCTWGLLFGIFAQQEGKSKQLGKVKKSKTVKKVVVQTLKEDTTDPICKMAVPKGAKQVSIYKGKQVGFCSIVCKEMFDENPKLYGSH
ncbi:YHS domain-containing protein [Arcicella sp. LKC2W]|uniref:YHS domain-containing protein n=1 Tax=Arcicella sp. LKC2W TaxID=2984198 RepID=UPI002B1F0960|nr:YHS domain-containing protein [Arcicella sp. LKC2W]MEA5460147.1 YHS domain-containing protein [Arcicella sp. LKC2W]